MLTIRRPYTYAKLLLQYYVNNRYSDASCMSMGSSELLDLEKKNGKHQLDLSRLFFFRNEVF